MAEPIRTRLDLIIPYLLARLRSVTGLTEACVFCSQRRKLPYDAMADQFVFIHFHDDTPQQPILQGAGRSDVRQEQLFSVTARTRLALDPPDRDTIWLTQASQGHLLLCHNVDDAMDGYIVEDTDGNWFTLGPIEPAHGKGPEKDDKATEWGEKSMFYRLVYLRALTQSYLGVGQ